MALVKHEMARISQDHSLVAGRPFQYSVAGLPAGEYALIGEFPQQGWRILRWTDEWHGNWTGNYESADAALDALREQTLVAAELPEA